MRRQTLSACGVSYLNRFLIGFAISLAMVSAPAGNNAHADPVQSLFSNQLNLAPLPPDLSLTLPPPETTQDGPDGSTAPEDGAQKPDGKPDEGPDTGNDKPEERDTGQNDEPTIPETERPNNRENEPGPPGPGEQETGEAETNEPETNTPETSETETTEPETTEPETNGPASPGETETGQENPNESETESAETGPTQQRPEGPESPQGSEGPENNEEGPTETTQQAPGQPEAPIEETGEQESAGSSYPDSKDLLTWIKQAQKLSMPKLQVNNAVAAANLSAVAGLTNDIANFAKDKAVGNQFLGGQVIQSANQSTISPLFGIWASGRLSKTEHDGFSVESSSAHEKVRGSTAEYEATDASLLIAGQLDVAKLTKAKDIGLKIGVFGGYANTDVDLGTSPELLTEGIGDAGDGENNSAIAGAFGLITSGQFYAVGIVSGHWGETDVNNKIISAQGSYDTDGFVVGGVTGAVFHLLKGNPDQFGQNILLDLRGGISHVHNEADAHIDSLGNVIGKAELTQTKGSIAAELSTLLKQDGGILHPFIKIGYERRFDYDNKASADDITFRFDDDDDTIFGTLGLRYKTGKNLDLSIDVRGDTNEDQHTISGKIGLKVLLN